MDPYAELDVPRNADTPTIKKAYRKASKRAHPDGGGTPEKFQRVSTALAVLTDPKRRKHFDETGKIEDKPIDNEQVEIKEFAMGAVQGEMDAYGDGPIYTDIVASARTKLANQVAQVETANRTIVAKIKSLQRLLGRFKKKKSEGKNLLEDLVKFRIAQMEHGKAGNDRMIRLMKAAIAMLEDYSFEIDKGQQTITVQQLHMMQGGWTRG